MTGLLWALDPLVCSDNTSLLTAQQPAPPGLLAWLPGFLRREKERLPLASAAAWRSLGWEASVAAPIVPAESTLIVLSKVGL